VQQQRRRPVPGHALPVDEAHRHLGAVRRGGVDPLGRVPRPVVARDRLLLEQGQLPRRQVVVEVGGRGDERLVREPEGRGVEDVVRAQVGGVVRLGEGDAVGLAAGQLADGDLRHAVLALAEHQVAGEGGDLLHHHRRAGRHQHLPVRLAGVGQRRGDHLEVPPVAVGADEELLAAVVDEVHVLRPPLGDEPRQRGRRAGVDEPHLGGGVALGLDLDEAAAAGAPHRELEPLVLLLVDQRVLLLRGAAQVAVDAVRPLRRVLHRVEQRPPVGGPGELVGVSDALRPELPGAEVLHVEGVLPVAAGVEGVREVAPVVGHLLVAHREERLAVGERVEVEDHLLLRRLALQLPAEDAVRLPRLRPAVIEVVAAAHRRRGVRLLGAPEHLLVEPLLERLGRLHHRAGVRVLRLQVGADRGVALVPQPEVVVLQPIAVEHRLVRHLLRRGR